MIDVERVSVCDEAVESVVLSLVLAVACVFCVTAEVEFVLLFDCVGLFTVVGWRGRSVVEEDDVSVLGASAVSSVIAQHNSRPAIQEKKMLLSKFILSAFPQQRVSTHIRPYIVVSLISSFLCSLQSLRRP